MPSILLFVTFLLFLRPSPSFFFSLIITFKLPSSPYHLPAFHILLLTPSPPPAFVSPLLLSPISALHILPPSASPFFHPCQVTSDHINQAPPATSGTLIYFKASVKLGTFAHNPTLERCFPAHAAQKCQR